MRKPPHWFHGMELFRGSAIDDLPPGRMFRAELPERRIRPEMPTSLSQEIAPHLPYLRRYARALTASQASGDAHVTACLEAILADPAIFDRGAGVKVGLYRLFHGLQQGLEIEPAGDAAAPAGERMASERLSALTPERRQVLLLTTLEGFRPAEAAVITDRSEAEVRESVAEALAEIDRQIATRVLIIEAGTRSCSMRPVDGQETVRRVLAGDPALHRPAAGLEPAVRHPHALAGRDAELLPHQVHAVDQLGNRVLDLDPGVHLEEVERLVRRQQELTGSRAEIAHRLAQRRPPPSPSTRGARA